MRRQQSRYNSSISFFEKTVTTRWLPVYPKRLQKWWKSGWAGAEGIIIIIVFNFTVIAEFLGIGNTTWFWVQRGVNKRE